MQSAQKKASAAQELPIQPNGSKVQWSYLPKQFSPENIEQIFDLMRKFVPTGDFTLGKPLEEFEGKFATLIGAKHAIGVNSGTDALKLSLKALGIGYGDEVITTANTFIATVGAIAELGAQPVLVDCTDNFCMDVSQVEAKITAKTKAIMPVHFAGQMTDMRQLMQIAQKHGLPVVEDSCQCILGNIEGRMLEPGAMRAVSRCIP
jgi:aminotransferase EvaB